MVILEHLKPPNSSPLVVFVNSKSGDNQVKKMNANLNELHSILNLFYYQGSQISSQIQTTFKPISSI
jgi:hypothetical protein